MFKSLLETIMERTEGSLGALIMGLDGISVEKVLGDAGTEANLDVAAAEFTSLVRSAQRAGNDTGLGNLKELMISLEQAVVVMRLLSRDY
ncbi:MAG: roadblock/LC7 domain-containing protein, partial [Acidobacteriales bacterium]|nr:roadblock/LC7 domain-containing protein [Terriglobales bacterium]